MQAGAIAGLKAQFAAEADALRAAAESGSLVSDTRVGKAAAHKRAVRGLTRKVTLAEAKREVAREELELALSQLKQVEAALADTVAYNARVEDETAKLVAIGDSHENKPHIAKLRELLLLNERLRLQEKEFKASCRAQKEALDAELEAWRGKSADDGGLGSAEAAFLKVGARYDKARAALAGKNREINMLRRAIDAVPSRTELLQYERRFTELYAEVSARLEETRKHYTTYNTLDSQVTFLSKEDSLVTSIHDNFEAAMKSKSSRAAFVEKCDGIVAGMRQTVAGQKSKLGEKTAGIESLQAQLQTLVDDQRRYFRAVRKFQEECDVNERLQKGEAV
jgi:hypothetical protein